MRRSRLPRPTRLNRFVRGQRLDRNPLRRRIDRLETVVLGALLVATIVIAPFAATAASDWEHAASVRQMHAQRYTLHQVTATVLNNAQDVNTYLVLVAQAPVRWTVPHGRTVTEVLRVPTGAKAGSVIKVWTNPSGQLVAPLRPADIPTRDGLAGTAAVAALGAVALLTGLGVRYSLNRRRMTAWDVDWMTTEPRWNSRR